MVSSKWTKEEEQILIDNKDSSIVNLFNLVNKIPIKQGIGAVRSQDAIRRKLSQLVGPKTSEDLSKEVAKLWKELEQLNIRYREEEEPAYISTTGKDRFILSMSDFHLPFTPIARIKNVLETHRIELAEKGCIVLNGDIFDQYAASTFSKNKRVLLLDEYRMALDLLELCLQYSEKVFLVMGNHSVRWKRLIGEKLDYEQSSIINTDLLARLANGEVLDLNGLVVDVRKHYRDRVMYQTKEPWYCRIGKTIFAHPTGFKSGIGGTVKYTADLLGTRYNKSEFDALVIGHTHSQLMAVVDNRLLIEQGAMCGKQGYEHKADLRFRHSQNGYCFIYQDKQGSTNFNDSRIVNMGSMMAPKKIAF